MPARATANMVKTTHPMLKDLAHEIANKRPGIPIPNACVHGRKIEIIPTIAAIAVIILLMLRVFIDSGMVMVLAWG